MSWTFAFDVGLAVLLVGLAIWTLALRQTFGAVVAFAVYGLTLTLAWFRLSAPDVALTEAAIGSGLTSALLLGAASRLRVTEAALEAERPGAGLRFVAAVLAAGVTAGLAVAVLYLPDPAPSLAPNAVAELPATGLGNAVTGVLMAYRAADTLLEKVVVLIAVIAVWSLADGKWWGGRPGPRQHADPDGALAFLARRLPPVGIVAGVYHRLGGGGSARRRVPGRDDHRGHVAADDHGGRERHAADQRARAAACAHHRAGSVPRGRLQRLLHRGAPSLPIRSPTPSCSS